jgi:hypothetical protein
MSRRYARLYSDGSLGVCPDGRDLVQAREELSGSTDDADTELVEVEMRIVQTFGKPKLQIVREHSAQCPTCGTEVYIEVPTTDDFASAAVAVQSEGPSA